MALTIPAGLSSDGPAGTVAGQDIRAAMRAMLPEAQQGEYDAQRPTQEEAMDAMF